MTQGQMIDRDWLHEFATRTREVTLQVALYNSCILSTHVGMLVLRHYGITVRPQPVTVYAFNHEAWGLADRGVPLNQWPASAWSVGINGTGASNHEAKSWDGHLVLVVRNPNRKRTLIDLTAGQLDRPQRGIHVPEVVFMDLTPLWTPQDPLLTLSNDDDTEPPTIVRYAPLVTAGDWQSAPDWQRTPDALVRTVLDRLDPPPCD